MGIFVTGLYIHCLDDTQPVFLFLPFYQYALVVLGNLFVFCCFSWTEDNADFLKQIAVIFDY